MRMLLAAAFAAVSLHTAFGSERDEFLQSKYGFCYSETPVGYQCTTGVPAPYCDIGEPLKNKAVRFYRVTAHYNRIESQRRARQSSRTIKSGPITCTAKNPHIKSVQECKDLKMPLGIARYCKVAIENNGVLEWYSGTVTIGPRPSLQ